MAGQPEQRVAVNMERADRMAAGIARNTQEFLSGEIDYQRWEMRTLTSRQELSSYIDIINNNGGTVAGAALDVALGAIEQGGLGYGSGLQAGKIVQMEILLAQTSRAAAPAAERLGIDLAQVSIERGVARATIGIARTLDPEDIQAVIAYVTARGAFRSEIGSGMLGNDRLDRVLSRIANRGGGGLFSGGTVTSLMDGVNDYMIIFGMR